MTVSARLPVSGLAVKSTPEASLWTMACTTTASATVALVDAVARPVADGARRPQAAPAVDHGAEQRLVADDVEKGVLLPGKGEVGQILGRGRGAHGHRRAAQRGVGVHECIRQDGRQRARRETRADGL